MIHSLQYRRTTDRRSLHGQSVQGFTIIEIIFAVAILTLITLNVSMVMKTSSDTFQSGVLQKVIDEQAELSMDRISRAIMSSSENDLNPIKQAPLSTPQLDYQTCLGYQDGLPVYGELERIKYIAEQGSIVWSQKPGDPDERTVVWSNWVPASLDGESPNGIDDNGNGLVDEQGLSFDTVGPKVNIRMTLRRTDPKGHIFKATMNNTVTCRN